MTEEREIKKCPNCKRDFWRDEMAVSGLCAECNRIKSKKHSAKRRRTKRDEFNEYHREYSRTHPGRSAGYPSRALVSHLGPEVSD